MWVDAREGIKARLIKSEARLRRLQAAIEAGVDPAAVVEGIDEAQAERAAAKAELENTSVPDVLGDAEIYAMIDSLGDVGAALRKPSRRVSATSTSNCGSSPATTHRIRLCSSQPNPV